MRRKLADEDHTGGFEPRGGLRVRRRDIVKQQPRMRGGTQPGSVVNVLEAIRNAMQRAAAPAAGDFALCSLGSGAGALGGDLDKSVKLGVERSGARQRRLSQRDRR